MGWLDFLRKNRNRRDHYRRRDMRLERIKSLGFEIEDLSGWQKTDFTIRTYYLVRNGERVAGPYDRTRDLMQAAEKLSENAGG